MARPGPRVPKRPSSTGGGELDSGGDEDEGPRPKRGPAEPDFSGIVRNKLHQYTRTGQACDRCKVRKIRCDALPEGCSHCLSQRLGCYVTDRVTGRTERRGYLQQLEREKTDMLAHIRGLEKLLQGHGVEVRPWTWSAFPPKKLPPDVSFDSLGNPVHDPDSKDRWSQVDSVWVKNYDDASSVELQMPSGIGRPVAAKVQPIRTRPTDNFLGPGPDSSPLSSIHGTKLSILGTMIDVTTFDSRGLVEQPRSARAGPAVYDRSVISFLRSSSNLNPPPDKVDLPPREEAFTYSEWYFLMIQPYLPALHKPSFINLLRRIYEDPTATTSVPELVIVHMVFANIYYQYGMRLREDPEKQLQLTELANNHYHWCLTKWCDLAASPSVAAVQALIMIAQYTRSFPKPNCCTIVSNFTFNKAIELNLHRAQKRADEPTDLENETRKRTWWTILALGTTLRGRLGWPMAIARDDFDTDLPLNIPDECITEDGITDESRIGTSPYAVGFMGFRISTLYMELYTKICCVQRVPSRYISDVVDLEEKLRVFKEELPEQLDPSKCQPGYQIFALYTSAYTAELELLLRHPSLSLTDDPAFCAESSRLSEQAADKLHQVVRRIFELKSLDTTWYQLSVYVGAMFTTLMAHWERRHDATPGDLDALRQRMSSWLLIFSDIGVSMGSGPRLPNHLRMIITRTISWIEKDMRHASPPQTHAQADVKLDVGRVPNGSGGVRQNGAGHASSRPGARGADNPPYPPSIAYGVPPGPEPSPYGPADQMHFGYTNGPNPMSMSNESPAPPGHSNQAQPGSNPLMAFAAQAAQQASAGHSAPVEGWQGAMGGGNPWHDWAAVMAESNGDPRYGTNNSNNINNNGNGNGNCNGNGLMDLSGAPDRPDAAASPMEGMQHDAPAAGMSVAPVGSQHAEQWPLLLFSAASNSMSGG